MHMTFVRSLYQPQFLQRRLFFQWLNIVFNRVDVERRKLVGPDLSCAEWLLRNGAYVKWNNTSEFITDYNSLRLESSKARIVEVEATDASIMHYGFPHFVGCNYIKKITFRKCYYLQNEAVELLSPLSKSLISLEINECLNLTEEGLLHLCALVNLKSLILSKLPYVKDRTKMVDDLKKCLPNCNVEYH